jgi:hypothetical protein
MRWKEEASTRLVGERRAFLNAIQEAIACVYEPSVVLARGLRGPFQKCVLGTEFSYQCGCFHS